MSEAESTSIVVNIFGKNYSLALDQGQTAEQLRKLAQLVDESMRRVHEVRHPPSPFQTAVLAGLNLADELFELQASYHAAESDITRRTSRLTSSLDRVFTQVQPTDIGTGVEQH